MLMTVMMGSNLFDMIVKAWCDAVMVESYCFVSAVAFAAAGFSTCVELNES